MPNTPPYKPSHLPAYAPQPKTLKSLPIYAPPSIHPCLGQKINNVSTLTTTKLKPTQTTNLTKITYFN